MPIKLKVALEFDEKDETFGIYRNFDVPWIISFQEIAPWFLKYVSFLVAQVKYSGDEE